MDKGLAAASGNCGEETETYFHQFIFVLVLLFEYSSLTHLFFYFVLKIITSCHYA